MSWWKPKPLNQDQLEAHERIVGMEYKREKKYRKLKDKKEKVTGWQKERSRRHQLWQDSKKAAKGFSGGIQNVVQQHTEQTQKGLKKGWRLR